MARDRSDREDLMAEAVALSPRIRLSRPGVSGEVVAGRRSDGRWSVYFDGDPVFHFDAQNRLWRAFVENKLYRSQGTTLARLTRQETPVETVLLRHDLSPAELALFLQAMFARLEELGTAIKFGAVTLHQSIPECSNFLPELVELIDSTLITENRLAPAVKK